MDDIVWATILIWFFLIAFSYARNELVVKAASGLVGIILMLMLMSESFLLGLVVMLLSIYIMYDAIFRGS